MSLPAMTPRRLGADTVLTGLPDRSALFGVLAEIDALGLDLLEVRQFTPCRESPEPGDGRSPWLRIASVAPGPGVNEPADQGEL
jgi:hypothetical protein